MTEPSQEVGSLRTELTSEHLKLERLFEELLAAFEIDDRVQAAQLWSVFDTKLRAHLDLEERLILPSFAEAYPAEAEALRQEHQRFRSQLLQLGIDVDLHATHAHQVQHFLDTLRRHAEREDALMYRFAQEQIDDPMLRRAIALGVPTMKPVLVLYASKYGQARRIAHSMFAQLLAHGQPTVLLDLREGLNEAKTRRLLEDCSHVVVVAALYAGKYPRVLRNFARAHRESLSMLPTSFVAVSLSQATVQDGSRSDQERRDAQHALDACLTRFAHDTGFAPRRVLQVAGALAYTQYNPLIRWLMKRIARAEHATTDTSRDHEFTDWDALRRWVANTLLTTPTLASQPARTVLCRRPVDALVAVR